MSTNQRWLWVAGGRKHHLWVGDEEQSVCRWWRYSEVNYKARALNKCSECQRIAQRRYGSSDA